MRKRPLALLSWTIIFLASCLVLDGWVCRAEGSPLLTGKDRGIWIRAIKRVKMKPPCCGACKIITQKETKMIWAYLTSPEPEKHEGEYLEIWKEHKDKLLDEFEALSPERYAVLYSSGTKALPLSTDNSADSSSKGGKKP